MGRSKGGMTNKILALTDALGNLVRFVLLPGHRYDTVGVPPLIDGVAFGGLIWASSCPGTRVPNNALSAPIRKR